MTDRLTALPFKQQVADSLPRRIRSTAQEAVRTLYSHVLAVQTCAGTWSAVCPFRADEFQRICTLANGHGPRERQAKSYRLHDRAPEGYVLNARSREACGSLGKRAKMDDRP